MGVAGHISCTELVAVLPQKTGDERPLFLADAGLPVEDKRDRRQRYAGGVGDIAHFHVLRLLSRV